MFSSADTGSPATWRDQRSSQTLPPALSFAASGTPDSPWWQGRTIPHARVSPAVQPEDKKGRSEKGPVLLCHLPQALRVAQEAALSNLETDDLEEVNGGLDPTTGIAWMLFGSKLYVWNYVASLNPQQCTILDFPSSFTKADTGGSIVADQWFVRIVAPSDTSGSLDMSTPKRQKSFAFDTTSTSKGDSLDESPPGKTDVEQKSLSGGNIGIAVLHKKTMAVVYWPDITHADGGGMTVGRVNEEWVLPHGSGLRPSGSFGSRKHSDVVTAVIAIGKGIENTTDEGDTLQNVESSGEGLTGEGVSSHLEEKQVANGGGMEVSEELPGCILVVGCNSGELWRLDCSTQGVRRLRLGREADASNSRSATFGMLAFGRNSQAPATVRGIVVLPDTPVVPSNSQTNLLGSEQPSPVGMWGIQERNLSDDGGIASGGSRPLVQVGFSGFRQKSKQKKQQQQQHVQQQELERQEKEKMQQAAEDMERGGRSMCRFLLLTAAGLEAWALQMQPGGKASLAWAYDILEDSAVRMDLAGEKQVWLLDLALSVECDSVIVLMASLRKDRASVSNYHTQYWLLSFILPPKSSLQALTKPLTQPTQALASPPPSPPTSRPSTPSIRCSSSPRSISSSSRESGVAPAFRLERKRPARIFVPKARVEEEDSMLLLHLTLGGKPKDSAVVLASDGTATVAVFDKGEPLLYQVDPNWPAGRVLGVGYLPRWTSGSISARENFSEGKSFEGNGAKEFEGGAQEMGFGSLRFGNLSSGKLSDEQGSTVERREGTREEAGREWALLTERGGVWVLPEEEIFAKAVDSFGRLRKRGNRGQKSEEEIETGAEGGVKLLLGMKGPNVQRGENGDVPMTNLNPDFQNMGVGWQNSTTSLNQHETAREGQFEGREGLSSEGLDRGNLTTRVGHQIGRDRSSFIEAMEKNTLIEGMVEKIMDAFMTGDILGFLPMLRDSGSFEMGGRKSVLAKASRAIVDTIPKHWGPSDGGGRMTGQLTLLSAQLGEKQGRHQHYLEYLSRTGCHQELQKLQKHVLTAIMEDGEKLAAVSHLRELHNQQGNQITSFDSSRKLANWRRPNPLWETVQLTGDRIRHANVHLLGREQADVFYTRVSQVTELFIVVQQHADIVIGRNVSQHGTLDKGGSHLPLPVGVQVERLCQLSNSLQSALEAAHNYTIAHKEWYPNEEHYPNDVDVDVSSLEESSESWLSSGPLRGGFWRLANLFLELRGEVISSEPSLIPVFLKTFQAVSCLVLNMYVDAISTKERRGEDFSVLELEYRKRSEILLKELVKNGREEAYRLAQIVGDKSQIRANLLAHYNVIIHIAKRHCVYDAMLTMCEELQDWDVLLHLMEQPSARGREGRFCHHVFQRFYERGSYGFLLSIGSKFPGELSDFLRDIKGLRWLHELLMKNYGSAFNTLKQQALSKDSMWNGSGRDARDTAEERSMEKEKQISLSFGRSKQLLALAKLSALVLNEEDKHEADTDIDASVELLKIQEMAVRSGLVSIEVVGPIQLAEACLKGKRALQLCAFDVFALGGSEMRRKCKVLLEQAWLNAVELDSWIDLKIQYEVEGWSEEQYEDMLRGTALFHASRRCYGKESIRIGEPFEAVLPLFPEDGLDTSGRGAIRGLGDSVQTLISRHLAYEDAGEAMIEALQMGRNTWCT